MLILIVLEIKNIKTIVYLDMVYIILYPFSIFFPHSYEHWYATIVI